MIRWSLQRGFICIPKSSSEKRIAENASIFDFNISEQDMEILVCHRITVELNLLYLLQNGLDEHLITDWPGIMSTSWDP